MSEITTQQVIELSEMIGVTKQQAYGLLLQASIKERGEARVTELKAKLEEIEELLGDLEGLNRWESNLVFPDPLVVQQTVVRHLVYIYKELLGESAHV